MKSWLLIIRFLVIFAIVCSPVLAISKLELIARYQSELVPGTSGGININFTTPSPTPTPTPTPQIPAWMQVGGKPAEDSARDAFSRQFFNPLICWTDTSTMENYLAGLPRMCCGNATIKRLVK
jgi:hypothetical protein